MNMTKFFRFTLLFLSLQLLSCKKEKLEGESAVLVGKWKWIYSTHYRYNNNAPFSYYLPNIVADTFAHQYAIEFTHNGHVILTEDGCKKKYRITSIQIESRYNGTFLQGSFGMEGSKLDRYTFRMTRGTGDSLLFQEYPFSTYTHSWYNDDYDSYFIRQ